MTPRRIVTLVVACVGLGGLCSLGGCTDESKTTGTMLQLTEKDKADIESMRAAMKGARAARKQEAAEERKERIASRKQRR